jgi:magnesium chelatase family protein
MESGEITISRTRYKVTYPAKFQLIAAMNPCPCGFLGDPQRDCHCSPEQVKRYQTRVSGPLLDRIDMHVPVCRLSPGQLIRPSVPGETSQAVRHRVTICRQLQLKRQGVTNSGLAPEILVGACLLGTSEEAELETAAEKMNLSGRAIHRTLRVARTIADMDQSRSVGRAHISEALAYRSMGNNL